MIPLFLALALAGPVDDGFVAWDAGDLDGAVAAWEAPLADGRGSAALHYNLGTAHYRKGDKPRAIAHWRVAQVIEPRNTWVLHNLAVARGELDGVRDPYVTAPPWLLVATAGEYGVVGTLLLLLASAGALVARWRRRSIWPWVGVGLLGLVVGGASVLGAWRLQALEGAVVVDAPAPLRALALPDATVQAELPPGTEVAVLRRSGEYLLVEDVDGRRGWMVASGALLVGVQLH